MSQILRTLRELFPKQTIIVRRPPAEEVRCERAPVVYTYHPNLGRALRADGTAQYLPDAPDHLPRYAEIRDCDIELIFEEEHEYPAIDTRQLSRLTAEHGTELKVIFENRSSHHESCSIIEYALVLRPI